jgi:hypothetical protein
LIAGCYLVGTNTRRVRRALAAGLPAPWQGYGEPGWQTLATKLIDQPIDLAA